MTSIGVIFYQLFMTLENVSKNWFWSILMNDMYDFSCSHILPAFMTAIHVGKDWFCNAFIKYM